MNKKTFNKVGFLLLLLCSTGLIAQVSEIPFRGGADNGIWTAAQSNSACVARGGANPFSGSPGGGGEFAALLNSTCTVAATLSLFNGGIETGEIFAAAISSECITLTPPSPFSGGINDGYATRRRTNYNCDGPNSTLDSIAPKQVCEGEEITIWGTYFSNVFEVYFNETPAQDFTVTDSVTITATVPQGASTGPVSVHGPEGTAYSAIDLAVSPLPVAAFTYAQVSGFTFGFTSTGSHATSHFWDFGDGNTSTETNPSFTFGDNGTWPVTLIVTNNCGNDTLLMEVEINTVSVHAPERIEITVVPNPFKDRFELRFNATGDMQVRVINMLGQLVYNEPVTAAGKTSYMVNMSGLSPGIYTIQLSGNNLVSGKRVVKGDGN